MTRVDVGTSGYSYREWKGSFYPKGVGTKQMLAYYASVFETVEINNTFYKMPEKEVLEAQSAEVPAGFSFAFKAPGQITHQKRLKDVGALVGDFWATLATVGPRLGPVLYGLPPNMKKDLPRLVEVLRMTPPGRRVAVEFRHESWLDEETYAALRTAGAALCIADAEELSVPFVKTAPWGYLRLRRARYTKAALEAWAARIRDAGWTDACVYFKHEDEARGPAFAAKLRAILGGAPPAKPPAAAAKPPAAKPRPAKRPAAKPRPAKPSAARSRKAPAVRKRAGR
jgi:uncharacterized protein YecE (DUF72 family)